MAVSFAEKAHTLARQLMTEYVFRTMVDTREVYVYSPDKGVYRNSADRVVESTIEAMAGHSTTNQLVNEVVNIIRRKTYVERSEFDESDDLLVVGNGILNLDTCELMPFSSDHLALRSVVVPFDLDASCPTIDGFLSEVLSPEDRKVVEMFLGYLLIPDHRYKKSLVLVGPKDTGKTTVLSLFFGLLGGDNVSGESLQDLCDNRFSSSALVGKIANIRDDLASVNLKNAEKLKELTGNFDRTRGEHKGMQSFQFRNRAKLVFSCNQLPMAGSADDVYYERWVIVEMKKQFVLGGSRPGTVADTNLARKMMDELPGLLNLAIMGRLRLLAHNGFVDARDAKMRYLAYAGHSVGRFFTDAVTISLDNVVTRADLYGSYQVYCNKRETVTKSEEEFTRTLKAVFPQVAECWSHRERAWRGLAVLPLAEIAERITKSYSIGVSCRPSDMVEYGGDRVNG